MQYINHLLCSLLLFASACSPQTIDPAAPQIPARQFDLLSFGAIGDGRTMCTTAFTNAIQAIAAAGGGRLNVAKGTYLTLPFTLTSHMELRLEDGALIQFPSDLSAFGLPPAPTAEQIKSLREKFPALIGGTNLTDIAITGPGIIDGAGSSWWPLIAVIPPGSEHTDGPSRPKILVMTNVQRLLIDGITLRNSPRYHITLRNCADVDISAVKIISPAESPHTDGIDPIGSTRIRIRNCDLDTGDDDIAIKAIDAPASDILIENCRCNNGRGISIGSETNRGIYNVTVKDCTFTGTTHGLHIKSARDRGNQLFDFSFTNIKMTDVPEPLIINLYYEDRPGAGTRAALPITATTPFLHDIRIENLTATGATAAGEIIGLPESPVQNLTLTNVNISSDTGLTITDAAHLVFKNVKINANAGAPFITDHAGVSFDP